MTLDRLNELKNTIYADYAGDDMFDLLRLIDAEIRRIESRRKVPLVPCRKCDAGKPMGPWTSFKSGTKKTRYICAKCGTEGDGCKTDREARIAWNEAMGGGKG